MCKICTYQALIKFTFLENIVDVSADDGPILLKQFCHLCLRKPYGITIHPDIYGSLAIRGTIDYNFVLQIHIRF